MTDVKNVLTGICIQQTTPERLQRLEDTINELKKYKMNDPKWWDVDCSVFIEIKNLTIQ
jgi:hypothetical protein